MTAHEDTPQDALSVFDFFEMLPDERAAIDQLCPWQEIQEGGQTLRKGEWLRGTLMPGKALRTALVRVVVSGCPGSFRGRIFVRKGRREAGKCDKLSFLRMCLS